MTVAALLADLRGRGVDVAADNGALRVEGPEDALSNEVLAVLKARKAEILRHLQAPVVARLVVVRHEHQCACGLAFTCTTPECAGKYVACVCCKLDGFEVGYGARGRRE